MKSLNKISMLVFFLCGAAIFSIHAEEPVCHHCEEIREYNAKYHHNYEYYDEYLKSEKNEKQQTPANGTNPKL